MERLNITKATEEYVKEHPSIKDCLKKGLINYSALARKIGKEKDIKNFEAILVAERRFYSKLKKEKAAENEIIDLMKKSKVDVKSKMVVAVIEKNVFFDNLIDLQRKAKKYEEDIHIIQGINTITIITSNEFSEEIKGVFKRNIVKLHPDLVEVIVRSPKEIEDVPGVIAYLYSLLSENNVNIIETMSSWTDTIFIIEEADLIKALNALKF
ncbi:MAG: ACT domain-containing protein [Nanoarchaeota archaeon]|nr:ACT domain-containing protein [Nanoarchaeota archaeon]